MIQKQLPIPFRPSARGVCQALGSAGPSSVAGCSEDVSQRSPAGEIILKDESGNIVTRASVAMDSVYAGHETLVELPLIQPLEPGDYTVSLSLEAEGASASDEAIPFSVDEPEVSGTPASVGVAIDSVAVNETRAADDALQAVEIVTTIENGGASVSDAQLTLTVERDDELVEEYVLGSSLSFPEGSTEFRQRYVPLEGWEPGTYTFSVTLEATDPNTDESVQLSTAEAETTVTVP